MKGKWFAGILLILLGIFFILEQAGVITADMGRIIADWWPCVIIAGGLSGLGNRKSLFSSLIVITVGALLLASNLQILPWGFWGSFWPAVLIISGISIITGKKSCKPGKYTNSQKQIYNAVFSGIQEKTADGSFKGATVNCTFAGVEIDLRDCILSPDFEGIDISVAFGGVKLFVPRNWRIEPHGTPVFGGLDNSTRPEGANMAVVPVSFSCFFGGIDISN